MHVLTKTETETAPRALAVVDLLRLAIEQGRLVPGQRLIEADLTREFGVSRGPLREALSRLSAEGLVSMVPNRGAVVRRLSRRELVDTMLIREALEGLAAALAARNIAKADNRSRFARLVRGLRLGKQKPAEEFLIENDALHGMLVEFADNEQLSDLIRRLRVQVFPRRLAPGHEDLSYRQASSQEHLQIAEAVLAGDEDKARVAMQRHLAGASERLLATLPPERNTSNESAR